MSVFTSAYSDHYDSLYAEKDYFGECDLIELAVKRYARMPVHTVLDIGCGTGSHVIEFARRGYKATGVDLSRPMLEEASRKSLELNFEHRPTWLCGDVCKFDAVTSFDLGIMMFAVVGYLTTNEMVIKGLRNIRRQLVTGGLLVCDFWNGPSVIATRPSDRVKVLDTPAGRVIRAVSTKMNMVQHTADVSVKLWTFQGSQLVNETTEVHRVRYFFPQEFKLYLELTGFEICSMTAFPSLDSELNEETWNALVVARAV